MSTVLTNPIRQTEEKSFVSKISNIFSYIGIISEKDKSYSISDHISYLLQASQTADAKTKSKIENHIVKLGKTAVPALVQSLFKNDGATRGMIAMALIRIGKPSVSYLEQSAEESPELSWISDYIIREIEGSQVKLGGFIQEDTLEPALVG